MKKTVRKERRSVILGKHTPSARGKRTGAVKLFAYDVTAIAAACGKSEAAVTKAIQRKKFDPADLESVIRYIAAFIKP